MSRSILIVRHGHGRGRSRGPRGYFDDVLDFVRETRPELLERIRVYETGEPTPPLNGVAAVAFLLGDPLREFYPECFADAEAIASRASELGLPMVNPPRALSNTIRRTQAQLWTEAGIPTPLYEGFESRDELSALIERMGYPVVVRSDRHHAQAGMAVLRSPEDLDALDAADLFLPGAVAPFVDVREGHRRRDPGSIYARLFHKKRVFVLGDRTRTEHVFFARDPLVSSTTFTFLRYGRVPPVLHGLVRFDTWNRKGIGEDLAYWREGEQHEALMRRAAGVLGLGYGAIDYSDLGDGKVILWEMNPYPKLPRLEIMPLTGPRRTKERMRSYHEAIARFLEDLSAGLPGKD